MTSNKQLLPSPDFLRNSKNEQESNKYFLAPCGMNLCPRRNRVYIEDRNFRRPARNMCKPFNTKPYNKEYKRNITKVSSKPNKISEQIIHCPVDGCPFRDEQRTVEEHVRTQHKSEVYDRIKKLSTPEEIAAWREERRKRFPTAAKRMLNEKILEQKRERGEVLDLPKQRSCRSVNDEPTQTCNDTTIKENINEDNTETQSVENTCTKSNLPSALSNLLLYASDNESDEEGIEPSAASVTEEHVENMVAEKVESCSDELPTINIGAEESAQDSISPVSNEPNEDNVNDAPEEKAISHNPFSMQVDSKQRNRVPPPYPKSDPFFQRRGRHIRRPNTLLAKLLEPHIRHERNVLLQCVRYVCSTNFLGVLDNSSKQNNKNK